MLHRSAFDVDRHRRERLRQAEQRAEWLDAYRSKLERLLGKALIVACAGTGVTPLALLDVLEELDDAVEGDLGLSRPRLGDLLGGPSIGQSSESAILAECEALVRAGDAAWVEGIEQTP